MTGPVLERVGLCAQCVHARVIRNRRGSTFYRCGRSDTEPQYPKYPPLPVRACPGYDPAPVPVDPGERRGSAAHD
jgi:hypothetical protein